MLRWLLPIVLLAGCLADAPAAAPEPVVVEDPVPQTLPPDAWDVRPFADAEAKEWNPAAQLILVAAFEGDLPDYSQSPLALGGDPWVAPFRGKDGQQADGRSPIWSFSYTVDDAVSEAAMALCERSQHAEVREAHIVTVDAAGQVLASYETRNDDEGSTTTGFLPEGLIGSADAAAAADERLAPLRSVAVFTRTFLMSEWVTPEPAWVFTLDAPEERHIVAVDATNGRILDEVAGPPC